MKNYISLLTLCTTCLSLSACETARIEVQPKDDPLILKQVINGKEAYNLGKSYLASSYYGLALEAFRKDSELNGPNVPGLNGLAVTYDMLGRYDLSQKYYEQALILDPFSPITYGNLAYSQYKQGEYENAQRLLEKARRLAAGDPEVNKVLDHYEDKIQRDRIKRLEQKVIGLKASYEPVRTSERSWALMQKVPTIKAESVLKYKANLYMEDILSPPTEDKITWSEPGPILKIDKLEVSAIEPAVEQHIEQNIETIIWNNAPEYRIINGTGRSGMAQRMSIYITQNRDTDKNLANAQHYNHSTSFIKYTPGYENAAIKLSKKFEVPVKLMAVPTLKTNIEFTLGADLLSFDTSLVQGTNI